MGSDKNMPAPDDEVLSGLSTFNRRLDTIFEILANLEQRGRSDRTASERDDQVINARLRTLIDDLEARWRQENEAQILMADTRLASLRTVVEDLEVRWRHENEAQIRASEKRMASWMAMLVNNQEALRLQMEELRLGVTPEPMKRKSATPDRLTEDS
ncbi:hypothetical protein [Methylobacterium mesophilicum]